MSYLDLSSYAQPAWFTLALAGLIGLAWALRRKRPALTLSVAHALSGAPRSLRQRIAWTPWALRLAAVALLAAAAARPQERSGETRTTTNGVAIMIVMDRSSSMREAMRVPGGWATRLDVVKRVVSDFVLGDGQTFEGRPHDLIGLVTFAANPNTVCPLVQDHDLLVELARITRLARERTQEDGTAIGDAIALAAARLRDAEQRLAELAREGGRPAFTLRSKVLILLTDGRQTRGDLTPAQAATLAREWGVTIHTISLGGDGRSVGADRRMLRAVAQATGGVAFDARDAEALRGVYEQIDRLETTELESVEYANIDERYAPLARAGLAALALHMLLGATVFRRARA